jgi:transcriptional regulator with XRE-family HTH domain
MDNRGEIKAFLSSRRAKITPQQAGLSAYARNRRVPGLRRGEVADLAGVSVEYYAKLERGDLSGVSDSVLEALARALQLDEAEHAHLLDLARAAGPAARTRRRAPAQQVRPTIQRLLDLMTAVAHATTTPCTSSPAWPPPTTTLMRLSHPHRPDGGRLFSVLRSSNQTLNHAVHGPQAD